MTKREFEELSKQVLNTQEMVLKLKDIMLGFEDRIRKLEGFVDIQKKRIKTQWSTALKKEGK